MLGLSKKTDYALLALSYLSGVEAGRAVRARAIAEHHDIPVELLAKILQKLAKVGMLASTPGPTGGYILVRPAREISIGAVVKAIEGNPALTQCMKADESDCDQRSKCTIRLPLERINSRVMHLLDNITLNEINGEDETPRPDIIIPVAQIGRRSVQTLTR